MERRRWIGWEGVFREGSGQHLQCIRGETIWAGALMVREALKGGAELIEGGRSIKFGVNGAVGKEEKDRGVEGNVGAGEGAGEVFGEGVHVFPVGVREGTVSSAEGYVGGSLMVVGQSFLYFGDNLPRMVRMRSHFLHFFCLNFEPF